MAAEISFHQFIRNTKALEANDTEKVSGIVMSASQDLIGMVGSGGSVTMVVSGFLMTAGNVLTALAIGSNPGESGDVIFSTGDGEWAAFAVHVTNAAGTSTTYSLGVTVDNATPPQS